MCLTLTIESKIGFLTSTSRLHLKFIYTSTRRQLVAKPELGTTPAPACFIIFLIYCNNICSVMTDMMLTQPPTELALKLELSLAIAFLLL